MKVALMILLIPVAFVELWICPPCFDVTFFTETVNFEFADQSYAMEFAEKNKEHLR